jgi:hypothetical protein
VVLVVDAFPNFHAPKLLFSGSAELNELGIAADSGFLWLYHAISTISPLLMDGKGLQEFHASLKEFARHERFDVGSESRLILHSVYDHQRSESSYKIPWIDTQLYTNLKILTDGFTHFYIRHPIKPVSQFLPSSARQIIFDRIHHSLDLGPLPHVQTLKLRSDGRFLTQEGHFGWNSFEPLAHHTSLRHLILDGPWLQTMMDYSTGVLNYIKTIKGLETLILDLDQTKQGPDLLYSLIAELPNLKHLGRLGRVDKKFWRLFSKSSCSHIHNIDVGTLKVPVTHLLDSNKSFFPDLAFGLLWCFPNLTRLRIYIGFQDCQPDVLLDIIKQLKEGLPLIYKEYEASIASDPKLRKLEAIDLLQMSDVSLLQSMQWNYVATKHGGGNPITISATDGITEGKIGRNYRIFGP